MLLTALLCLRLCQDPAPAPEQPAPDPAPQEVPAAPPEIPPQIQELMELVDTIRGDFSRVDEGLAGARRTADAVRTDDAPLREALVKAQEDAGVLIGNMEKLLEKLPRSDKPSSSAGADKPSSSPPRPPDGKQDDSSEDQENQEATDRPEGGQEEAAAGQRSAELTPEQLRALLFLDLRAGTWGMLPIRLQETLDNAAAEDLPLRYRRWLEEYHRRSSGQAP